MTDLRARTLARLAALGLDLPPEFTKATVAFDAIMAMQPPAPPPGPRAAITDAASQALATAYRTGSTTVTIDTAPVAQARAAEAGHADRAAIIARLRETAPLELCRTADQHRAQITAVLKARHAQIIGELIPAARRLPPAITETAALDAGGQTRADYLATRDLTAQAEQLRAALVEVEDTPARGQVPDLAERCLTHIRDLRIYDRSVDGTAYGQPGTPEFYRALGRETEPGDWWLPTTAERHARYAELTEQARLAGVAQLPDRATVW